MVTGIIVDTFGELRVAGLEIENDSANVCFMCGKTKQEIDDIAESSSGFSKHIGFEHNMWDYVFYCAYLYEKRDKLKNDINNLERYVLTKLDQNDHTWLPAY
jgi:predicted nucleic-acid-binding Zn-ribbon protein